MPVFFLYSSKAFLKIGSKFEVDEEDAWRLDDMVVIARLARHENVEHVHLWY